MNLNVRGIHYHMSDETSDFLNKKLEKLSFCEDYLQDLDFVITRETKGQGYHIDAKLHFTWKKVKLVSQNCYELYEGIDSIVDKIISISKKEKEKVQEK